MPAKIRLPLALALAAALWCAGGAVFAQQSAVTIDETKLIHFYDLYLQRNENDSYVEKRIAEERAVLRGLIDDEIHSSIDALTTEDNLTGANLTKALERQRGLVASLEERERERKLDLDLLNEEEKKFYLDHPSGSGGLEGTPLTHSHAELLAKKAILEERIASLETVLPLQRDRLSRLKNQQLLDQFGVFINLAISLGILMIAYLLNALIQRLFISRIELRRRRYLAAKAASAVVYALALIIILTKALSDHPNIVASVAIIGAGVAVALQDVIKDIVGWLAIVQKRYFSLGDRIFIDGYSGDVIDISLFTTALLEVGMPGGDVLERTGKTLYVPNALVLTKPLLNFNTTSDFTKGEMQVTITYESDWKQAKEILEQILSEQTDQFTEQARLQSTKRTHLFYVFKEPGNSQVYVDLTGNGVTLTLRFNVPIGRRRDVVSAITEQILSKFRKEHIALAYNTARIITDNDAQARPRGSPPGRAE